MSDDDDAAALQTSSGASFAKAEDAGAVADDNDADAGDVFADGSFDASDTFSDVGSVTPTIVWGLLCQSGGSKRGAWGGLGRRRLAGGELF